LDCLDNDGLQSDYQLRRRSRLRRGGNKGVSMLEYRRNRRMYTQLHPDVLRVRLLLLPGFAIHACLLQATKHAVLRQPELTSDSESNDG